MLTTVASDRVLELEASLAKANAALACVAALYVNKADGIACWLDEVRDALASSKNSNVGQPNLASYTHGIKVDLESKLISMKAGFDFLEAVCDENGFYNVISNPLVQRALAIKVGGEALPHHPCENTMTIGRSKYFQMEDHQHQLVDLLASKENTISVLEFQLASFNSTESKSSSENLKMREAVALLDNLDNPTVEIRDKRKANRV